MNKERATRIAVVGADDRALSSVWRLWSHNEEFYVAVRGLASQFKTSLHSKGNHRHAFVSQEIADQHRQPGLDRAVYKWTHSGAGKSGPSLFYKIAIPAVALGTTLSATVPANVKRLRRPADDEIAVVSVTSGSAAIPMQPDMLAEGIDVLDTWNTPGGIEFMITSHVDRATTSDIESWRRLALNEPTFDPQNIESADERGDFDPRTFMLMDAGADGVGRVVDLGIRELSAWARR